MNKRLAAIAIVVAAGAATAGLLASTSTSASTLPSAIEPTGHCYKGPFCSITLIATGPDWSRMIMPTGDELVFENTDSVTHTVAFANGHCNFTVPPGIQQDAECNSNFAAYVGSYGYVVDGKFPGFVITIPWHRSVTLTARRHWSRRGARLTLHGALRTNFQNPVMSLPEPAHVVVLARHDSKHPFEPIATVLVKVPSQPNVPGGTSSGWKLNLRPAVTTTYIAKVTGGTLPHWQGPFWASVNSRPFTVRIRH